jgi:predicted dehydrogenase
MSYQMAVLGTGGLGVMLGKQVRRQPKAELAALADISEASRAEAGDVLGVPPEARYETLEDLLDGEDLDALTIATPHTLHYDQVCTALDRGLHVLCEKPLVTDLDDARDLDRRANDTDGVLMVGYQRHLEPEYRYARRRWGDGDSEPTFISAEITEDWLSGNLGTWRVDPSLSGGGFLADTADHVVDAILWTTDLTPTTVEADMDFETEGVDTRGNVTIEFESGANAHLSFHADVPRVTERLQGWDSDGGVRIEGREWGDRSITVIDEDGSEVDPYLSERDSAYEDPRSKLDGFVDAIEGTTPPPATTRDAVRAVAVTEAAYESARTGEPVSVDLSSNGVD